MLQGSATYCGSCLSPSSQSIAVFGENGCWIPRQISVKRTKQREREMGDVAQNGSLSDGFTKTFWPPHINMTVQHARPGHRYQWSPLWTSSMTMVNGYDDH
ncbi:hypothetical protein RRG08_007111 [Elysia crispata]|uniref:Uncharacterized protein n=1 Tax=Elysia crispata TaxID=231223 RepID=A0AAE1D7N8_9GAST|nr:hypothetical protein RRG08_007111 [Elysia crispata]